MSHGIEGRFHVSDHASRPIRDFAERVQALGLHVTSATTKGSPVMPNQTRNPHDRRNPEPRHSDHYPMGPMLASTMSFTPPGGLEIDDLHAIARNAAARGADDAHREAEHRHEAEMQAARREAWEEGHAAGKVDGGQALLDDMEERLVAQARMTHHVGMQTLQAMAADPKKVTKADLERRLDSAVDVLAGLITLHGKGFAPEPPF